MELGAAALPSSWLEGQGWESLTKPISDLWNNVTTTAGNLWNSWSNWIQSQLQKVEIFGVNLGQWLNDDPLSASAGLAAAGLSAGVIFLTGGAAVGKIVGGIKVLWQAARGTFKLLGLGALIRAGVQGVQRIWNFNWNISDKQIRETQKSQLAGLAGTWGEALGSMVGTLCGWTLGRVAYANQAKLIKFNPDIIAKLDALRMDSFDEDSGLWEEAVENLKSALGASLRVGANLATLEAYLNVRKAIKAVARGVDLNWLWPGLNEHIQQWGSEESKPWSFAQAQEEWVESLPEGAIQNFVEEFLEAAQDQCAESSIQVSYAL
jgi:hypothetical protein